MPKFKLLDLFSGIGGFSLGLERSGAFKTVAFCEIEPYCRAVLKKHWPEVPCYEDIRELTANRLEADGIGIDAICGGFPCQDISIANTTGKGIDGERSGLWKEYARLISELRPSIVVVENVAALLSRGLGRVLGDLAEIGYDAEWHCIPAAAVGAVHLRERLWIVAYPNKLRLQGGFVRHEEDNNRRNINATILSSLPFCTRRKVDDLPKPYVVGSNDGIPNRAYRTRALGNSVVPQIPEIIGRAIAEAML